MPIPDMSTYNTDIDIDKFNTYKQSSPKHSMCLAINIWPHAIIKQTKQITLTQRQHSRYLAKLDSLSFILTLLLNPVNLVNPV